MEVARAICTDEKARSLGLEDRKYLLFLVAVCSGIDDETAPTVCTMAERDLAGIVQ